MKNGIYKRLFALVLVISMLLPIAAKAITISSEETQSGKITSGENVSVQLPEKVSVAELTRGTKILNHIDEAVLETGSHILRLPAEETLNSYAFLNQDGSMSVYYMDKAVKYVDRSGEIVEKDLTLTKTVGGFTTVTNDIGLILPDDPANGINMSYEGHNITLVPMGGVLRSKAQNDGESVIYPNYYGGGMSLKYTPSLDGLKEDIVLSRYSGVNSFTFRLFTDGLRMYQEDGSYYLAKSANAEVQISLGDVVAFDAKGKFSIGTMTVETVTMGQEYLLTLSVDTAFLTSLTTSYPVCIDPTLQVSDNTHVAGAIEDLTVYSGVPTLNADWPYLHCGYYDSTYRVARTLFRLPGLLNDTTYQSISADDITSVTFHIKEATGSAGIPVHLHANTGNANWTESGSNWNNAGYVVGTRYAVASPGLEQFACYDITDLAKAWKEDEESAQAGFVLVSSNEVSVDKAFYSAESSNTGNRSYVVVDYNVGTNFDNAIALSLNQSVPVAITASGEKRYFKYTPNNAGFYTFANSDITGDSRIWLYNSAQAQLENEYSTTEDVHLTYHLIAWQTYYIVTGTYLSSQSAYNLKATYSALAIPPEADIITTLSAEYATIDTAYETKCFKFTPSANGTYVFQSNSSVGDPYIWLYNSSLMPWGVNDDDGEDYNFRLCVELEAGKTYYVAVGHSGSATGTIEFAPFMQTQIMDYIYYIKNADSGLIMDVESTSVGEKAQQNAIHSTTPGHWRIQQQSDGTYTIGLYDENKYTDYSDFPIYYFYPDYSGSPDYYLGISNTSTGQNNVILYSEDSTNTRWNIYETADHRLLFEPISALGKVLYAPNDNIGTEMQLVWGSLTDSACQWYIGGYNSLDVRKVPSRTIALQCVGELANNSAWYPLIEAAVEVWNDSGAGVYIQLTDQPSKYTLEVIAEKKNMYTIPLNDSTIFGQTIYYGEGGPENDPIINYNGVYEGVLIQISQELIDEKIGNNMNARISIIAHEIGHLFSLADYDETRNDDGTIDDGDMFFLGDNSLISYCCDKTTVTGPTIFDIRNVLFVYE